MRPREAQGVNKRRPSTDYEKCTRLLPLALSAVPLFRLLIGRPSVTHTSPLKDLRFRARSGGGRRALGEKGANARTARWSVCISYTGYIDLYACAGGGQRGLSLFSSDAAFPRPGASGTGRQPCQPEKEEDESEEGGN